MDVMLQHSEVEDTEEKRRARRVNSSLVLSVAFVTRVAVVWYSLGHLPRGWFYTRGVEMGLLGKSLLDGCGLCSPFGAPTGPTAMIAPAYPIFVAGIFRLFGSYTVASSVAIMGTHVLLNLVTVWLIMRMSRRFADERAAILAGIFWACSPPLLWIPTIFWDTSFSIGLLLGFVAIALDLTRSSSQLRWMGCGVYCGIAGLVNPALLPSLLMIATWTAYKTSRQVMHKPALAVLTFLIAFSPWPIRNAKVFHAFIPTRTTVGLELWMGNHPGSTGYLVESLFPTFNASELAEYKAEGELLYTQHKGEMARQYIFARPMAFTRLTLVRIGRFWTGTGNSRGSIFFTLHATLTTLLGLIGLFSLLRSGERGIAVLFLLPIALFPVPYFLTHAEFRYRLVLDPLMCVLAAIALQHLCRGGTRFPVPIPRSNGDPIEQIVTPAFSGVGGT